MENSETPVVLPETNSPKNRKRIILLVIAVLLTVVIALAVALAVILYDSGKEQASTPEVNREQTPSAIIESIKGHMRTEIAKDTQNSYELTSDKLGSATVTYRFNTDYLVTSLPETNGLLNYRVIPKNTTSVEQAASNGAALKTTINEANTYIQTLGFTELAQIEIPSVLGNAKPRTYKYKSVYCQVNDEMYSTLSVSCVQEKKLEQAAAELLPFVKIYEATGNKSSSYSELTTVKPKNGYDIKKLYSGEIGYALYFVSEVGSTNWQYLDRYSTQSIEECSKYESSELARKVFAGELCYVTTSPAKPGVPAQQIERIVE